MPIIFLGLTAAVFAFYHVVATLLCCAKCRKSSGSGARSRSSDTARRRC
jgi:hypothetical protein